MTESLSTLRKSEKVFDIHFPYGNDVAYGTGLTGIGPGRYYTYKVRGDSGIEFEIIPMQDSWLSSLNNMVVLPSATDVAEQLVLLYDRFLQAQILTLPNKNSLNPWKRGLQVEWNHPGVKELWAAIHVARQQVNSIGLDLATLAQRQPSIDELNSITGGHVETLHESLVCIDAALATVRRGGK